MESLKTLALLFGGILGTIIVSLLKDELSAWLSKASLGLVRLAAARVPKAERERRAEEWQADVLSWPGTLSRMGRALAILWGARRCYQRTELDREIGYQRNSAVLSATIAVTGAYELIVNGQGVKRL